MKDFQEKFGLSLAECEEAVETHLQKSPYSREQIRKELGANDQELREFSLNGSTQESQFFLLTTVHPMTAF